MPSLYTCIGFSGGSVVKNLPAKQEMWVQSLGWEDPLEKEMATHSSILAWENPWSEETGGLQSMGLEKSQTWLKEISTYTHGDIYMYTYIYIAFICICII